MISVVQSKNPGFVGTAGIVLQETENIFRIITRQHELKTVPKVRAACGCCCRRGGIASAAGGAGGMDGRFEGWGITVRVVVVGIHYSLRLLCFLSFSPFFWSRPPRGVHIRGRAPVGYQKL